MNNVSQIKRILKVLGQNFAASHNVHARKGGLIGLAAVAIALGKVIAKINTITNVFIIYF